MVRFYSCLHVCRDLRKPHLVSVNPFNCTVPLRAGTCADGTNQEQRNLFHFHFHFHFPNVSALTILVPLNSDLWAFQDLCIVLCLTHCFLCQEQQQVQLCTLLPRALRPSITRLQPLWGTLRKDTSVTSGYHLLRKSI